MDIFPSPIKTGDAPVDIIIDFFAKDAVKEGIESTTKSDDQNQQTENPTTEEDEKR